MARTVITYDVYERQPEIKQALIDEGWTEIIDGVKEDNTPCKTHLPNTSLWHKTKSAKESRDDFKRIAGSKNIERCVCYEFTTWAGFVGKPHKNDDK